MANKTTAQNTEQSQSQPSTPQMEKEQPIVNGQEQDYPVNLHEDFTSEKEMNQRSQQEEGSTTQQQQISEYDKKDIEVDSEDVDNGLNKIPKMNP